MIVVWRRCYIPVFIKLLLAFSEGVIPRYCYCSLLPVDKVTVYRMLRGHPGFKQPSVVIGGVTYTDLTIWT